MRTSVLNRNIAIFFFSTGIGGQSQLLAQANNLPNIVLILADDLGYGDVSAYNHNSKIQTPCIDNIAKQGVRFLDAHSNSSVCTPTRYGILTGRHAWRSELQHGVLDGYDKPLISKERLTIASLLHSSGYSTACIGKWHLGWNWAMKSSADKDIDFTLPIDQGPLSKSFDYFFGISASLDMPPYVYIENKQVVSFPERIAEGDSLLHFWRKGPIASNFSHEECLPLLTQKAIKYIDGNANRNNPFFLYFALPSPHTPILPQKEFRGKTGLGDYGDYVAEVDQMIGNIVKSLKDKGIYDNTILIIVSDNGCSPAAGVKVLEKSGHYPSAQFRGYKADLYEGGHRVPFIVAWPDKIRTGRISKQVVCTTDFMATFAQLTGYKLRDNQGEDSFSFYHDLCGHSDLHKNRKIIVSHSYYGNFAIRKGPWKLLLTPFSGGWSYPQQYAGEDLKDSLPKFQLYNLRKDIGERNNVINEYPEKVKELKKLMIRYISTGRSTPGKVQKNDVLVNTDF